MRHENKEALQHILDTFSGSDGGVSFVALKTLLEEMDRRAVKGDTAAVGDGACLRLSH